jgi:cytidylate kinase
MIIAIDGPAGAGKSTVARGVARALGLAFLDTGAMYRAVTLEVLRRGLDPAVEGDCWRVASSLELAFDADGKITIDGAAGEPAIRAEAVTRAVSAVSAHARVRRVIVEHQRRLARAWGGLVAEGRDTTTVVFPHADHKFFLTASPRERARRRALEIGAPERAQAIQAEIEERDRLDSTRAHSPLRQAADAVAIDTDRLDPEGATRAILAHIERSRPAPSPSDPAR